MSYLSEPMGHAVFSLQSHPVRIIVTNVKWTLNGECHAACWSWVRWWFTCGFIIGTRFCRQNDEHGKKNEKHPSNSTLVAYCAQTVGRSFLAPKGLLLRHLKNLRGFCCGINLPHRVHVEICAAMENKVIEMWCCLRNASHAHCLFHWLFSECVYVFTIRGKLQQKWQCGGIGIEWSVISCSSVQHFKLCS